MATTTLAGTTGNDILNAPGSVTTLVAGFQGSDTITLVDANDEGYGNAGADSITVNASGAFTGSVGGGDGHDTLYASTAVTSLGGASNLNDGNDVFLNSNNVQLVNASIGGNAGDDTIVLGNGGVTNAFVGGGKNADSIAVTAGTVTNSSVLGGGGADTITIGSITANLATIQSSDGHDRIEATALTGSASLVIAAGKGLDSIQFGATTFGTVAGGANDDTVAFTTGWRGGVIFGDGMDSSSAGIGTGADSIGATTVEVTGAGSVYGGGGSDTISFSVLSANAFFSGQNGGDLIGTSGVAIGASLTAATLSGGAGHDTLSLASTTTGVQVLGGDGVDSIMIAGVGDGSINGGTGNDTINYAVPGILFESAAGLATINGGAGSDQILLGSWTAGGLLATVGGDFFSALTAAAGNVASVGSGDTLFFATTASYTSSNWVVNNQVAVLSAAATTLTAVATAAASIAVRESGDDLIIGLNVNGAESTFQLVNLIGGADLMTTTTGGAATAGAALVINSSNFGFTIAGDTSGVTISFT